MPDSRGGLVKWGVMQFPGSCDERDALKACEMAGEARLVWHEDRDLSSFDGIVIPGGFSHGDYLRAGAIARFAPAVEATVDFAMSGKPVLGICNGFQVLCEAGLLPGALLLNLSTRFTFRQVDLIVQESDCVFTRGLEPGTRLSIPAKHATGRYYAPPELLEELEDHGQVALRYATGHNFNGSTDDIAGVTNADGNVLGLMPHPEHAVDALLGSTDGLRLFRAAADALTAA